MHTEFLLISKRLLIPLTMKFCLKSFTTMELEVLLYPFFRSDLTGRSQFVSLAGIRSVDKVIRHGVPQGSVLGPLLFLLHINYLIIVPLNTPLYIILLMIQISFISVTL